MRKLLSLLLVAVAAVASLFVGSFTRSASAAVPASNGIAWYNANTGETRLWYMNSHRVTRQATVLGQNGQPAYIGPPFKIVGTGDLNGDQSADILWYNTSTGESQVWFMDGNRLTRRATVVYESGSNAYIGPPWKIVGNGDMNGDTKADILWYNTNTGETQVWFMNGNRRTGPGMNVVYENGSTTYIGPPWKIVGNGDMNGDTKADILWYNTNTGETQVWFMNGNRRTSAGMNVVYESGSTAYIGPPFTIVANSDMNGDGKADIVWYNAQTGETQLWFMNGNRRTGPGMTVLSESGSIAYVGPPFTIVGAGKFNSPSSPTGIDDYPYRTNPVCDYAGGKCGNDRWGFTQQQCVSFVAWRLEQRGVSVTGNPYGDAGNWDDAALRTGTITVDDKPAVGAVAQWDPYEKTTSPNGTWKKAGSKGHVAYVTAVNADGTVNVEEYNQGNPGDQSYHQSLSVTAKKYIHF